MDCRPALLLALVACADADATRPGRLEVRCRPQSDVELRWDCAVRGAEGPLFVEATNARATVTRNGVTLWGLAPDSDVRWTVRDGRAQREGTFHTAPLIAPLAIEVEGEARTDHVLFPFDCRARSWLAIARTDGTPVWIEPIDQTISGFGFEAPDTVLATLSRSTYARIRLDGHRIDRGPSPLPLHHDVVSDGHGRVIRLVAQDYVWSDGTHVVLDGLSVTDTEGNALAEWWLADHARDAVPPERMSTGFWEDEYPGAGDWSHGNGVTVAPGGDLLVSLRWWSTVYRIAGPGAPDFGSVRWVLASGRSPLESDLRLVSETGDDPAFSGQHHPILHPDGTLTLFDNGPRDGLSRVLRFRIDEHGSTATLVGVIPLDVRCALLGSAFPVADGGLLVTCADHRMAWEFGPGETTPRWTMSVACDDDPFTLDRVVPVVLPDGPLAYPGPSARSF